MKKFFVGVLMVVMSLVVVSQVSAQQVSSFTCTKLTQELYLWLTDTTTNGEVSALQRFLVAGGYLSSADAAITPGTFGVKTQAAVKAYQSARGLAVTGSVGAVTRAKIADESCAGTTVTSTQATVSVIGTPTLALTYDSAQKESQLTATYTISITAGNIPIQLYSNGFNFFTSNSNGVQNINSLTAPEEVNAANGNYVINPGVTKTWTLQARFNPKIMFAGTYSVAFDNLPVQINGVYASLIPTGIVNTNKITIVGETSPYITSVTDTVTKGGMITLLGSRMYPITALYLDGAQISIPGDIMNAADGTKIYFNVPLAWTEGRHSIQIANANGKSNLVWFTVGASTPGSIPTARVVGTPTFALTYNSLGKEAQLTGTYMVEIKAGNQSLILPQKPFYFTANSSTGDCCQSGQYVPLATTSTFIIPAGETRTFNIRPILNPNLMFAGTYTLTLEDYIGYCTTSGCTGAYATGITGIRNTNPLTIVGERAPYISSLATTTVTVGGKIVANGVRLTNAVYIDGVAINPAGANISSTQVTIPVPVTLVAGSSHYLQIANADGMGNKVWFQVSGGQVPTTSSILTLSSDPNTPKSLNWKIGTTEGAKGITVGTVNVKSEGGNSKITKVAATISGTGTTPTVLYLFDGTTMVDSKAGTLGTITFDNLNLTVTKDQVKTLTFKADMSSATARGSAIGIGASTTVWYVNSSGSPAIAKVSTITINKQYFYPAAPQIVFVASSATANGSTGATTNIAGTFTFKVRPMGGSMSAFAQNGSNFIISTSTTGPQLADITKSVTVTPNDSMYADGGEYTVTLSFLVPNSGIGATGLYTFYVKSINWNIGNFYVTQTYGLDDFKTNTVTFTKSVVVNDQGFLSSFIASVLESITNLFR